MCATINSSVQYSPLRGQYKLQCPIKNQSHFVMPSIEPRTGVEEGSSSQLEDILTTIPLLKSHANKPNVSIVHPIPRAVVVVKDNPPPVAAAAPRDAFLANLEAQIQRPALENHSGLADSRKYPTSVIPKRRQVNSSFNSANWRINNRL